MTTIEVSLAELREIEANSGERLHDDGPFPVVHLKGVTYWANTPAPLVPQQRTGGAS